jgi:hypothetical protein
MIAELVSGHVRKVEPMEGQTQNKKCRAAEEFGRGLAEGPRNRVQSRGAVVHD